MAIQCPTPTHGGWAGWLWPIPHQPAASHHGQLQSSRESSLSQGVWFQSPGCARRWSRLFLVGTSQPPAQAQAPSPPTRWRSTSLKPVSLSRDRVVGAPAFDCRPIHYAPAPYGPSYEPTGGRPHVTLSGWARPGPMGGGPATRRSHANPNPGSREGPGCAMPEDVLVLVVIFFIMGLWTTLSLPRHQGPVCLGRPYQGHIASDNIAPRIIRVLKPLHPCSSGSSRRGLIFFIFELCCKFDYIIPVLITLHWFPLIQNWF